MKYFFICVFSLSILLSCKTTSDQSEIEAAPVVITPTIEVLDKPAFKDAIKSGKVQLVDVRTPEEFAGGHIEKATNIDFLADDFSEAILEVNKDKPVYIYCRSGNRSGQAAQIMQKLGFKTIYDLKGGYLAWSETDQ
ncbi:MAG: rhodanese-like domain-containing protein [Flavobacteriaceae bacterium]|nr:rhodanese-like domain-containing protein [Bacteroidia bacterium]MBT8287125.1 rhodanese-like domain-containing protein [Bacteroidia bacterium]NNF73637.1 rhodanese-like domain-containing protein [Flavobacteriaceae bacterium]NNK72337.1 rhodanese-like domain-containing protein [Flavobacteriaceae bacterium]